MTDRTGRNKRGRKRKAEKQSVDPEDKSGSPGPDNPKITSPELARNQRQKNTSSLQRLTQDPKEFLALLDFLGQQGLLDLSEKKELYDALLGGDENQIRRALRKDREKTAGRTGRLISDYTEAVAYFEELHSNFEAEIVEINRRQAHAGTGRTEDPVPESDFGVKLEAVHTFREIHNRYFLAGNVVGAIGECYAILTNRFDATRKLISYYQKKHPALLTPKISDPLNEARSILRYAESEAGVTGLRKLQFAVHTTSFEPSRSLLETQQMVLFDAFEKAPDLNVLRRLNSERRLDWLEKYLALIYYRIAAQRARAVVMRLRDQMATICDELEMPEKTFRALWRSCNRFSIWLFAGWQLYQAQAPTVEEQALKALEMRRKRPI